MEDNSLYCCFVCGEVIDPIRCKDTQELIAFCDSCEMKVSVEVLKEEDNENNF